MGPNADATPERESEHTKLTVTGALFQPNELALGLLEPVMLGGTRSMLTLPTVVEVVFPALSVHVPAANCPAPGPARMLGLVVYATPDRASEQMKLTVTGPLFQPFGFGPGLLEPVIVGEVRSMLIGETVAVALFPALSAQVPRTDCPAPVPSVVGLDMESVPDRASVQVKLIVTGELFQPFPFGGMDLDPVIVGGVLSMFIPLTVAETELPALSVQVEPRDWPEPSVETTCGVVGSTFTPDSPSAQVKDVVTSTLFHPFVLREGDFEPVSVGAVVSMLIPVTLVEAGFPALSVQVPVTD